MLGLFLARKRGSGGALGEAGTRTEEQHGDSKTSQGGEDCSEVP